MPFFAGQDRGSLRVIWHEAWRKHRLRLPLEPLEAQLADVLLWHPEYHQTLESDPGALDRDWTPEGGQGNPFLHMGLHATVRDGIATDRPRGIRDVYEDLLRNSATAHEAEHALLDCLGETLWEAQRAGLPPDELAYLDKALRASATRK
jgi:hypothetical protein